MAEKTRRLAFIGAADHVDMRAAVGLSSDDKSYADAEALAASKKFIFYPATSRSNRAVGLRQAQHGVEMTEEQAFAIMTHPGRPEGFVDITERTTPVYEGLPELIAQDTPTVESAEAKPLTQAQVMALVKGNTVADPPVEDTPVNAGNQLAADLVGTKDGAMPGAPDAPAPGGKGGKQ